MRFVAFPARPIEPGFGAATFYQFFTLKPAASTRASCARDRVLHQGRAATALGDAARPGIKPGETTPDGKVSLLTARCLGSCGLAPAVVYDNAVTGKISPADLRDRVKKWTRHDS